MNLSEVKTYWRQLEKTLEKQLQVKVSLKLSKPPHNMISNYT